MVNKVNKFNSICLSLIIVVTILIPCGRGWCDVDFDRLHGSDLGMGIGARAIALGGAFVAIADDPSALFWNPAGLTQIDTHQFFLSMDLPAYFSSAAFIYQPGFKKIENLNLTVGLGVVNRLDFEGDSGSDFWEGYGANLLDMAMIDIGEGFSGEIDSDTHDLRLSMAIAPGSGERMSLGVNVAYIL